MNLLNEFTSTGSKMFVHQEAMQNLRNGQGQPIVAHVMLTDVCQHTCAFCSVQHRAGDVLPFSTVTGFLEILMRHGLKAVILSGGGNPILYKCKETGKNFNDVADWIHERGLQIGLITNGMPLKEFGSGCGYSVETKTESGGVIETKFDLRRSWGTVNPETLDKLTWIRLSLAGLDHEERQCYVPDIDPSKTTLGMSYVAHDVYEAPEDKKHGKVSTEADVLQLGQLEGRKVWRFEDRIPELTEQIRYYVEHCRPAYVRILPNCLEPSLIPKRCEQLQAMANAIDPNVVFVQQKPPQAPKACWLGYVHPVLNCDGYVYPCDSCVLNEAAGHSFGQSWRICRWDEIGGIYERPIRSLIADPAKQCPGCVFSRSNAILGGVVDGTADITPPGVVPLHVNFV